MNENHAGYRANMARTRSSTDNFVHVPRSLLPLRVEAITTAIRKLIDKQAPAGEIEEESYSGNHQRYGSECKCYRESPVFYEGMVGCAAMISL
jgi:hypothetical protein